MSIENIVFLISGIVFVIGFSVIFYSLYRQHREINEANKIFHKIDRNKNNWWK